MSPEKRTSNDDLARERGFANAAEQDRYRRVDDATTFEALPLRAMQARQQALDVLADVRREGLTVEEAARRHNITPQAVEFWAQGAVTGTGTGWTVASSDQLYRRMYIYTEGRVQLIDVRSSADASVIGRHNSAVGYYLATGDDSRLRAMRGTQVDGIELETDADAIDALARQGEIITESIYEGLI